MDLCNGALAKVRGWLELSFSKDYQEDKWDMEEVGWEFSCIAKFSHRHIASKTLRTYFKEMEVQRMLEIQTYLEGFTVFIEISVLYLTTDILVASCSIF
jgi:hypothetical protein